MKTGLLTGFGLATVLIAIFYFGWLPAIIALAYWWLNFLAPLAVFGFLGLAVLGASLFFFKKNEVTLWAIILVVIAGLFGFWQYDACSEYILAKSDYFGYHPEVVANVSQEIKTLPSSFKLLPKAQAEAIRNSLIGGQASVDNFSDLKPAYKQDGEQIYVYYSYPKNLGRQISNAEFKLMGIVNGDIESLTNIKLLPQGGILNSDLSRVLREKSYFSYPDLGDLRWVETHDGEWFMTVPDWGFRWDGLFRNYVWRGNYFIQGETVQYVSKENLVNSKFSGLNVMPQAYTDDAAKLFELFGSDNYLSITFGQAPRYTPSNLEADHTFVTEGGVSKAVQFEFLKPSGDSHQVAAILSSSTGSVEYRLTSPTKVADILVTPDISQAKVQTVVLSSGQLAKLTGTNATSIATWEVGEFVPVFEQNQMWYLFFVFGSHDHSSVNAVIGIRANSSFARSSTQVSDITTSDIVIFKNATQVGNWLTDGTLPDTNELSSSSPQLSSAEISVLLTKMQALQKQNEQILELLRQ